MSLLYLYKYSALQVFLILLLVLIVIDIVTTLFIKSYISKKSIKSWPFLFHCILSILIYFTLFWAFFIKNWQPDPHTFKIFFFLTNHISIIYLSKLFFIIFSLIFFMWRKKAIIKKAIVILFILFISSLLYGLYWGRFHYIVKENEFVDSRISQKLKLVFVSDFHLGQYVGNENKIEKIIQIVNNLEPDFVLFGGDMLCCFAQEMKSFIPYFQQLKSKYGIYAVHGNHDYGDYYWWKNKEEKEKDHLKLENFYNEAGIKLLKNETINFDSLKVSIVGIENCGKAPYPCYAELDKALNSLTNTNYTILLSHDPQIWKEVIREYSQINLTLSGHTHAYQFGFETKSIRFSIFFPKNPWNGKYEHNSQYLYITHGVGSAMFSARLGMWPEISLIKILPN